MPDNQTFAKHFAPGEEPEERRFKSAARTGREARRLSGRIKRRHRGASTAPRRCLDARKAEGNRCPLPVLRRPFDDPLLDQGGAEFVRQRDDGGEVGSSRLVGVRPLRGRRRTMEADLG